MAFVHDIFGHWTISKGKIEEGEDPKAGAIREIKEEMGLDIKIVQELGVNEYVANDSKVEGGKKRKRVSYFLAESAFSELRLGSSGGLDDAQWFPLSAVGDLNFYDDTLVAPAKTEKCACHLARGGEDVKNMEFSNFEKKIEYTFKDKRLLETAFTHRSYLNENRSPGAEHNERLEFLGDAVLELVITEFLFAKYPDKPEGDLTAYRAALVNTQSISDAAGKLGMNEYLLLSKGESRDTGRARQIILANAFEALIGAIYLDSGYEAAKDFIGAQLFHKTDEVVEKRLWQDAKSKLQEVAQEKLGVTPTYEVVSQSGPDHDKKFVVAAHVGSERVANGEGKSKQEAEQDAAQKALAAKGW